MRTPVGLCCGYVHLLGNQHPRTAPHLQSAGPPPQLTAVSPKKTVEGAVGGLLSSIVVALGLYKVG